MKNIKIFINWFIKRTPIYLMSIPYVFIAVYLPVKLFDINTNRFSFLIFIILVVSLFHTFVEPVIKKIQIKVEKQRHLISTHAEDGKTIISNTKLWFIDRTFEVMLFIAFAYIFKHLLHIDGDLLWLLAMSVGMLTAVVIYKQVEKTKLWAKYRPTQK